MSVGAASGSDQFLRDYWNEIQTQMSAPGTTQAWKDDLKHEFDVVKAQVLGQPASRSTPSPEPAMPGPNGEAAGGDDRSPASPAPSVKAVADTPKPGAPASDGETASLQFSGGLPPALQRWMPDIAEASRVTGEDPALMAAQVWQESRGQSGAGTTNGGTGLSDLGLMQVDAGTFTELQAEHPQLQGKSLDDPLTQLEAGGFYEQDMQRKFGSEELGLRGFNSGPNSVDPSDPDTTTTGLGDPTYVQKTEAIKADILNGTPLPA